MKNKLIVLEGIDGVGKTTIAKMIKRELGRHHIKSVIYESTEKKNSGFNILKPFIKKYAAKLSINSSLFFYLSSTLLKSEIIKKMLKNKWVICDRYIYSTLAYHKIKGATKSLLPNLNKFPIIKPDFSFLITVDDKTRLQRVKKRKIINQADLIPKKQGSHAYKMETELKKFKLTEVKNDSSLNEAINFIVKKIFPHN
ncbi:MAG: dTMP kinase [bacterium]|nr:dTMP kinase [bacterium]